ncbi:unnamed protein product [Rotaria sp. Silwood2]|nr:unnamed protein product [Rotaria sp. Silwood2]
MESNEAFVCPLCRHDKIKIFAVGECCHPVCHLCSTKMRVLCEQTYCAICRQELPRVNFVSDLASIQPTIDQSRFTPIDETGDCGIYYPIKVEWIRRETEKLLRNFCPFCYCEYETFEILRDHVRRTHRYFYCDLCVENLNLFPHERKCYTRHDLVQHTRYGDRDDTSFKGHPLCRFCDDHFLDVDQLYKHMRKEHYYCHLCTDDNVYYSDFDLLRDHYRSSHYFCEIGQCKDVQFTNVFSSEIDFRAHQAAQHSKNRAEARQLGTIPVEFQTKPMRDRPQQGPAHRGTFKSGEFKTQGNNNNSTRNERDDSQQEPAVAVAVPSIDEFPTLGERSSTPQNVSQQRGAWLGDSFRRIDSSENFPALASSASNVSNTNVSQRQGIWREQQQQQQTISSSSSTNLNVTSKKAPQPVKPLANGTLSVNLKEDFPALKGASNARIPAPVSMFSAWSTAKKSAKNANANAKANQPPMRLNTNRLINDDEDDECIRRPMTSLTTSTTPIASSNIKMISSSDLPTTQINEKQNKNKKQSLPNAQDFPALPSTTTTQDNVVSSNVWVTDGTNPSTKLSTKQEKKKSAALSKKKFIQEVQGMPPPALLSSTNEFRAIGLSQLGQRLITDENQPTVTTQAKEDKPPSPLPPPPPSSSSIKQEENKSKVQSNKKIPKATKTNDSIKQETPSTKNETQAKSVINQASSQPLVKNETVSEVAPPSISSIQSPPSSTTTVVIPPPPGFATPLAIPPPPGFNAISPSQPAPPSYVFTSSYSKQKDEFRAKLFDLFDGNMNLFTEYDTFCEAFSQNKITSKDFITYTTQLFKDKFDDYLPELIVIMPNIEQQNELYSNWKKDIQSTSLSSSAKQNKSNWTKKTLDEKSIHICRICRQIMFESDVDEHNSYHTEFNSQFPSLPTAAVPIGRGRGKTKK